jgi:hypothetical protein
MLFSTSPFPLLKERVVDEMYEKPLVTKIPD